MWTLTVDGAPISLPSGRLTIGRAEDNDLALDDPRVSRHHAVLEVGPDGRLTLTDLGSGNGTLLDGRQLQGVGATVPDGAQLTIGDTVVQVGRDDPGEPPASQRTTVVDARVSGAAATLEPEPAGAAAAHPPDSAASPVAPPGRAPATVAGPDGATTPGGADPAQTTAPRTRRERPAAITASSVTRQLGETRRTVRLAVGVACAAVIVAIAAAVLAVTGVFSPSTKTTRSPPQPLTIAQIVHGARRSVVYVQAVDASGNGTTGTGWVVNGPAGEIVTNGHVVEGGPRILVNLPGQPTQPATLVAVNRCADVALLKVSDTTGLRTLRQGRQRDVQEGDPTVAIGFPYSGATKRTDLTDTTGVVSVVHTSAPFYPDVIETDAPINPGNSGGPLLDSRGHVIGMDTFTSSGQNQDYAIAIDQVDRLLPALRQGMNRGWAGLALRYNEDDDSPDATIHSRNLVVFGPEITGLFPGATPGRGITGDTGNTTQYLVAIDGVPFVPDDQIGDRTDGNGHLLPHANSGNAQLPADDTGWCQKVAKLTKGQTARVTILTLANSNSLGGTRVTTLHFR